MALVSTEHVRYNDFKGKATECKVRQSGSSGTNGRRNFRSPGRDRSRISRSGSGIDRLVSPSLGQKVRLHPGWAQPKIDSALIKSIFGLIVVLFLI